MYFNADLSVLITGAGGLLLVVSFLFKTLREKIVPLYVAAAMIIAGFSSYHNLNDAYNLSEKYVDKTVNIKGVITDKPDYSNFRYYYVLNLASIDGQPADSDLRLSLPYEVEAEPFDVISLDAKVYKIASQSREVQNYYYSKGVFLGAYASEDSSVNVIAAKAQGFEYGIYQIREKLISNIMQKLPNEYGATIVGMLLGDKSGLTDSRVESFREAGVSPIFAVSGLHLSIWVMGLYSILDKFNVKKRINSAIGIIFTVLFMFLAGLSPSVCRAGLMMIMMLSANLFYRKSDSLNSLGFAAFVLCLINPFTAIDTGFLLSFSATLAIVLVVPLADKYLFSKIPVNFAGKFVKAMLTAVTVSLSASIGVLPVTILFIGKVSVYSAISNLLLSPVATVCMLCGGLSAITFPLGFISDFFALISGMCAKAMLYVIDIICSTSVTMFSVDNIFWKTGAICSVAVLILSAVAFKGKTLLKAVAVGLSVILVVLGVSSHYYYDGLTQIRILNVGNGISAVVHNTKDKIVLTGEADDYLKPLKINESVERVSTVNPDLIILADKDAAYDPANLNLIKTNNYNRIILPEANSDIKTLTADSEVIETSYAAIDVLENDNVRLNVQKEFSVAYCKFNEITVLFVFDNYKKAQIPQEYIDADYLVCCGYIPECIRPQDYKNVIICGEKERISSVYDYVVSCGGSPVFTDDFNEIVINVREGKHRIFQLED